MRENENDISGELAPGKIYIPKPQKILLLLIMIGYPLLTLIMNYINPPGEVEIVSRIVQIYLPGLAFQMVILLSILLALFYAPLKQDGIQWNRRENLAGIGIRKADLHWKNFAIGVIFLFSAIIVLNFLSNILGSYDIFSTEDISYLLPRTGPEKVFWIILSISAGVAEELAFRGFVLTRMEILTGSIWPGVILGSLCFGIGHLYQGWSGVILIAIYGGMFSLLFYARGSLIPCIVAHILQDVMAAFAT